MSNKGQSGRKQSQRASGLQGGRGRHQWNISIRGIRRSAPNLRKYAQVVIELAQAKIEADAQAEHELMTAPRPIIDTAPLADSSGSKEAA